MGTQTCQVLAKFYQEMIAGGQASLPASIFIRTLL